MKFMVHVGFNNSLLEYSSLWNWDKNNTVTVIGKDELNGILFKKSFFML